MAESPQAPGTRTPEISTIRSTAGVVVEPFTEVTTRRIAYSLIGIYGFALGAIAAFAAFATFLKVDGATAWLDLLKSGFLILGGALSTIVGYYFGSRGTQEAEARAQAAQVAAERLVLNERASPTRSEDVDEDMELP